MEVLKISKQIYFDYQSAKPVDPRVIDAMFPYFSEKFGNPSSLHNVGDIATEALEKSRETIAKFIHANLAKEIIFTSGATESNNMAIIGYALKNMKKGKHIIISEIEHISIFNITKYLEMQGFEITKIPTDKYGKINLEKLKKKIKNDTILISIGYANNEIGTIQQIKEIGKISKEHNIAFHSDAVAAEGLIDIDVNRDNIDLLTLSSNDIYGPKGVGALYLRNGFRVNPIIIGGGQEGGLRSGSENVAGIVGMAKAAEICMNEMDEETNRLRKYQKRIIEEVLSKIPKSYLNGHPTDRLPNNIHFRFEAIEGESILLSLKDKNINITTGSACSSKTLEPSHTLIAIGLTHEEAHGSMEITMGRWTKQSDIDILLNELPSVVQRLREISPLWLKK